MILLASFISLALIGCPADAELPPVTPTDNSQWSPQTPFTPPKTPAETPSPQVPSTILGSEKVNSSDTSTKPLTGKSIVFVEGVSQESGWYDVNKVGRGENGDINMCWAF